jgi:hypothetical protein
MKKQSGRDAVLKMRDEFLLLVAAYNAVGEYKDAQGAQVMAIVLNDFEDNHVITNMEWPPRVTSDQYGPAIAELTKEELSPLEGALLIDDAVRVTQAMIDVLAERGRQQEVEKFDAHHDDQHVDGELAAAAGIYALHNSGGLGVRDYIPEEGEPLPSEDAVPRGWPFAPDCWKPKDARADYVRAAALLIAEIERIDRSEGR